MTHRWDVVLNGAPEIFQLNTLPATVCLTKGKRIKLLPCKIQAQDILTLYSETCKTRSPENVKLPSSCLTVNMYRGY